MWRSYPKVIAVDFWSLGDVPEFVFDVNQKNLKDGTATADNTAAEARSQEQELEGRRRITTSTTTICSNIVI